MDDYSRRYAATFSIDVHQPRTLQVMEWKQVARAELAYSSRLMRHASAMIDMVKAFERVPHYWLVRQGSRYAYPMQNLKLSIAA